MNYRIFFVLLISAYPLAAQVIINGMDSYVLNENVYLYKETRAIVVDTAWMYFKQHRFSPATCINNKVNEGLVKNIYWIAIPIRNATSLSHRLEAGIANGGIFG